MLLCITRCFFPATCAQYCELRIICLLSSLNPFCQGRILIILTHTFEKKKKKKLNELNSWHRFHVTIFISTWPVTLANDFMLSKQFFVVVDLLLPIKLCRHNAVKIISYALVLAFSNFVYKTHTCTYTHTCIHTNTSSTNKVFSIK